MNFGGFFEFWNLGSPGVRSAGIIGLVHPDPDFFSGHNATLRNLRIPGALRRTSPVSANAQGRTAIPVDI